MNVGVHMDHSKILVEVFKAKGIRYMQGGAHQYLLCIPFISFCSRLAYGAF